MKVSPISHNKYSSKNLSFNAVNQKFLQEAKETYERCKPYHNQGFLLTKIDIAEAYGKIPPQDYIDTLEAIKPYAENALECINDMINVMKDYLKTQ